MAPLLGVYAEKVAGARLVKRLKDDGYEVVRGDGVVSAREKHAKEALDRLTKVFKDSAAGKVVYDPFPNPGKKPKKMNLTVAESKKGLAALPAYRKMGLDLGDRVFDDLNLGVDARFYTYDVQQTGQLQLSDTSDIRVVRWSQQRLREKYFPYSLKAYLGDSPDGQFLEMVKDPMGFLAMSMGVDKKSMGQMVRAIDVETGERYFDGKAKQKFANEAKKVFGAHYTRVISEWAEAHDQCTKWVKEKQKELQKTKGLGSTNALDYAKSQTAYADELQMIESDMKTWQLSLWIKFFDIGLKKQGDDFKKAVLEILDLDKNSPVLITAGLNHNLGRVITSRRAPRKDLKKLLSVDFKDLDIKLRSEYRPTGPALRKLGINEEMESKIYIDFMCKKELLYSVEGKLNIGGSVQWYAKVGPQDKKRR